MPLMTYATKALMDQVFKIGWTPIEYAWRTLWGFPIWKSRILTKGFDEMNTMITCTITPTMQNISKIGFWKNKPLG